MIFILYQHASKTEPFKKQITTDIITKVLKNAYLFQKLKGQVILHTNLGSQYTSQDFKDLTLDFNIVQSFSRKGYLYDYACIESFHAILKKEEIYQITHITFKQAKLALFQYIED